MGDNNEQEAADLAAMNNDDDDDILLEVTYRGGRRVNIRNVNIRLNSIDVPFRLTIHASVTEIDEEACWGCTTLTEVVFHNNVITIGRNAFACCLNLKPVQLPAGLLRLEYAAFDGCESLLEITIPASVQYIGVEVFAECTSLESVVFEPRTNFVELGSEIFWGCTILRFVTLPQNLRSIPVECFRNCTSLTRLQIPVSVTEIGAGAFWSSGIQATKISEENEFMPGTIMLPPKLQSISNNCFGNCQAVTNIQIPDSVQQIGDSAVSGSGLRTLTISKNIRQIDQEAFENCVFLERVTIHSTNLNMGNNIFNRCPLLAVIEMSPYLWPTLFASMKGQPDFIIQFFRLYHPQIIDVAVKDNDNNRWWCWSCQWWR